MVASVRTSTRTVVGPAFALAALTCVLDATTSMAPPAHAAKVAFGLTAGEGAEDQVMFRAAPGERNRVRVRRTEARTV